jgi:hypothetical protein
VSDLTYVYCLVRSARTPALPPAAAAMPGAKGVRLVDAGKGLRLVVSTVREADYSETALAAGITSLDWVGRRALAHEAVVEHFLGAPAVLPMQMFSLFTSDERALAHVTRDRLRIDRILDRLQRQQEWGLRLTFDEQALREAVEQKHADGPAAGTRAKSGPSGRMGPTASGAAYLARKRDLLDVSRQQLAAARTAGDRVFKAMSSAATAALRRRSTEQAPGARLLLDAAFLVPSTRVAGFRAVLRKLSPALPSGVVVSLTGPWPPYNFIDAPPRSRSASRR